MSNKKTIPTISSSEASKMSVSALAVRPNDASRFGQGGLSTKALQEWFDKLPNLVKEKFNEIAQMLASTDAAKYITLGGEDNALGETLFDFLALFGPRGDGITDKNISDLIETLYQKEDSTVNVSTPIKEIVHDIERRIVKTDAGRVTNARFDVTSNSLIISFAGGNDLSVDLSAIVVGEGVSGEIERLKDTDADHERRIANIEEHISDDYFVTDETVAYEKAVPARACSSAKLMSLGGMTYRDEETNTLRDSKVTEIKSHGKNLFNKDAEWYAYSIGDGDTIIEHASYRTWFIDVRGIDNVCVSLNNLDAAGDLMVTALRDTKLGSAIDMRYKTLYKGQSHSISLQGYNYVAVSMWYTWVDEVAPYVQIEAGSVATEYKPFREPISYPIPAEIQAIEGYGKDGFNIDLVAQESDYNGEKKPLPVFLDSIIKVEGGGSLEFVNEYKNAVPSAVKYLLKEESAV